MKDQTPYNTYMTIQLDATNVDENKHGRLIEDIESNADILRACFAANQVKIEVLEPWKLQGSRWRITVARKAVSVKDALRALRRLSSNDSRDTLFDGIPIHVYTLTKDRVGYYEICDGDNRIGWVSDRQLAPFSELHQILDSATSADPAEEETTTSECSHGPLLWSKLDAIETTSSQYEVASQSKSEDRWYDHYPSLRHQRSEEWVSDSFFCLRKLRPLSRKQKKAVRKEVREFRELILSYVLPTTDVRNTTVPLQLADHERRTRIRATGCEFSIFSVVGRNFTGSPHEIWDQGALLNSLSLKNHPLDWRKIFGVAL